MKWASSRWRSARAPKCVQVINTGHLSGTLRTPPLILGHEAAGLVIEGAMKGSRVTVSATRGMMTGARLLKPVVFGKP